MSHARNNQAFEDDYFFISQLFDEDWQPNYPA